MPFRDKRNSRDDNSSSKGRKSSGRSTSNESRERQSRAPKSSSSSRPTSGSASKFSKGAGRKPFSTDTPRSGSGSGYGSERKKDFNPRSEGGRKSFSPRAEGGFSSRTDGGRKGRPGTFKSDFRRGEGRPNLGPHRSRKTKENPENEGLIRLNRYVANAGICSRRKADELIEAGVISVNGVVVTELGTKVDPAKDEVRYNGERLKREKMVYVLLNKPKDYITTTDDPQERKTVMDLVAKASKERIYPVGRLDRNTTGLLLFTNDGNLSEKLSHPRNNIIKLYHVELNKNLTQGDFNKIAFGLELEDGFVKPDEISYVAGASKREVGIKIHSGKNRIVRRIFEHLGYDVVKLDRVVYANLTKKDLPRGRWRFLDEKEIIQLKHLIK